jgi:hypothetical protein
MLRAEMNRVRPLIALVVVGLVGAGVAIAAGGSSPELHACASKRTGALRLLSHGKCKHSEREVSWNVAGPAGKQGPAGRQGSAGGPGAGGQQGAQGTTGATGVAGTARAYAYVLATGPGAPKLDPSRTKGFTAVAYSSGGAADATYCLTPAAGISPSDSAPVASPVYLDADAGQVSLAYPDLADGDCAAGDFEVETFVGSGSSQTPNHGISFDIVVP